MIVDLVELQTLIRDEDEFSKVFKRKIHDGSNLGLGLWERRGNTFCLSFPDESSVTLKFFAVIKPVFDYRNIEIPGKESYLSYIDVIVRPAGIKAYQFKSDVAQHVWGVSQSKARTAHEHSIFRMKEKMKMLGIEFSTEDLDTRFDRSSW